MKYVLFGILHYHYIHIYSIYTFGNNGCELSNYQFSNFFQGQLWLLSIIFACHTTWFSTCLSLHTKNQNFLFEISQIQINIAKKLFLNEQNNQMVTLAITVSIACLWLKGEIN